MNRCRPYRFVHPLRGCVNTRGNAIGYRYASPNGDEWRNQHLGARHVSATTPPRWEDYRHTVFTAPPPQCADATTTLHSPFSILNSSFSHTFSAKERDTETGLSYFGSRYYSSDLSIWLSVDPMSDKYPSLSPYVYCADNPVKLVDPNGEDWVEREVEGRKEVYYDRSVKSQADVNKKYGESSGVRHLADGTKVGNGQYTVYNDHKGNKNGVVKDANGNTINPDRTIIYGKGYTLFAGVTDESVNAESLHTNLFGSSYIGADNPKSYNGEDNYDYQPTWSPTEMAAYRHDKAYDAVGAEGVSEALLNQRTKCADQCLIYECKNIAKDPKTNASERSRAQKIAFGFSCIDFIFKTPRF